MASPTTHIGIVSTVFGPDIRHAARGARSAGFEGVQIDAMTSALDVTTLSITGRRELRHVVSGQNLEVIALRCDIGSRGFGPSADIDAAIAKLDSILAAARGMALSLICVDIGPLPAPPPEARNFPDIKPDEAGLILIPPIARPAPDVMRVDHVPLQLDPTFAASVDGALAELGRRADRHGIALAFRSDLASYAALDRALKAADCPWFGIDLDPAAMLADTWHADTIFSRLGGHIRHVRGRDALLGADHRTKPAPIGQGSVEWDELLSMLDSASYHGWITIDPQELQDRPAGAHAGLTTLKKLLH